jgi:hypothetical protein
MATTAPAPTEVRYSQGTKDIGAARAFSWEFPVPRTAFWDDLPFSVARNFLTLYTSPEDGQTLPSFDDAGNLSYDEKLQLLLKLLQERIAAKDAAAAPQTFYDVDYPAWDKTWLAVVSVQQKLGNTTAQEETLRMMIAKRKDTSNLSHLHNLSALLVQEGKYEEAEKSEVEVRDWLDSKLGKESPQSLSARRIIAEAVSRQPGRKAEGEKLLDGVDEIIAGTGEDSPYAVYKEEQSKMTKELREKLAGEL